MNLIQLTDCSRDDDEFSWKKFYFIVVKEKIWQKVLEVFCRNYLNIIVNVNFFEI